ncbi:hypothetical protein ACHAQA_004535 [Verticillium albo-atrum]
MSQQIQNVALAGATGSVGSVILESLLESGKFNITILARKAHPSSSPTVKTNVVDFESLDALTEALKGQHALLDATLTPDASVALRLIDAAVAAGVSRFVPSEYSLDPNNVAARSILIYAPKNQIIARLQDLGVQGKLTWTSVSNGALLDWTLRNGFVKIDLKNKKAQLISGGNNVIPWTLLKDVGRAVTNVLLQPEETKNRFAYVSTIEKSQKQVIELAKEALGKDGWEVTTLDMEPLYKDAVTQIQTGNATFEAFGNIILYTTSRPDYAGPWAKPDNDLLGIKTWGDDELKELITAIAAE